MTFCTPPCQHQDYCIYFGCPFMREPQSFCPRDRREAMPHHARGTHPVDRPGLSVLGKREGPSRKTEQGAGTTLNAHEPGTRSFSLGIGPGHHQPRSMTRGFASWPQPASGRARDRAIGPADSRNSSRGGVEGHAPASEGGAERNGAYGREALRLVGIKPGPRETYIHTREHQVTDETHHVRSAIVNSKSIPKFGRVATGRNPSTMEALTGITSTRPRSHHWIVRGDVTAAANSQVTA